MYPSIHPSIHLEANENLENIEIVPKVLHIISSFFHEFWAANSQGRNCLQLTTYELDETHALGILCNVIHS